jgi:hypothetical protein
LAAKNAGNIDSSPEKRTMNARFSVLPLLVAAPLMLGGCVGLRAGSTYPDYSSGDVRKWLLSPENHTKPSISLNNIKIKDEFCEGLDTYPETHILAQDDLSRFLKTQGVDVGGLEIKARGNLFWFDFPVADGATETVRLRVAVLDNAKEAAMDLHESLLEHGPGWWGLHRSNLAILAPKAGLTEALAFAMKYKLVCWGQFWMTDADDVYAVPGPYAEL